MFVYSPEEESNSDDDNASKLLYPRLSEKCLQKMQMERFHIFKEQDLEKGCFDVTFEIEKKTLFANKHMLATISETMNAWLSDRWSSKDKPVKIQSYTYDNFYEFLCFIYSGNCKLTNENVFQLVDMGEFFGIIYLKKFCDQFLFDMRQTPETIEEMYEFAVRYSLPKLLASIKRFIRYGKSEMFNTESFHDYKKIFVVFISSICREPDYNKNKYKPTDKTESEFFEWVYKWAEHQVQKQKPVDDENFNVEEAIKIELEPILSNITFSKMNLKFLKDFVVEKGFILSPNELNEFFKIFQVRNYYADNEEDLFKFVCELAEKQAIQKQKKSPDPENFNIAETIKTDLVEIIPQINFYKMDKQFLNDFVVTKGILTEEQASHVFDTKGLPLFNMKHKANRVLVDIMNNGNTISGVFKDVIGIRKALGKKICNITRASTTKLRFTRFKFTVPRTKSTVKKMNGIDWYLCLEDDGILTFKHYSAIQKSDYLLAEMKSDIEFKLIAYEMTRLTSSYRNLYAL